VKATNVIVALVVLGAATAGGYWLGGKRQGTDAGTHAAAAPAASATASVPAKKVLYYRNPMGLPDTSPTPKKDPMGMDYIPVYEGEDADAG
jgi:Cu(I)/Ag(I) efflux system membrane fusion protein